MSVIIENEGSGEEYSYFGANEVKWSDICC
jgi:hypothetical protein